MVRERRRWTLEDDVTLLENYHLPLKDLSKLMGRSVSVISANAKRLGVSKNNSGWSVEEDNFLLNNPHMPLNDLSYTLGRSQVVIRDRRNFLGLSYKNELNDAEINYILENTHLTPKQIGDVLHRSETVISKKAKKLGVRLADGHKVARRVRKNFTTEELQYLVDNSHLPDQELALRLGRNQNVVSQKLRSLGINRKTKWTEEEDNLILYSNLSYEELVEKLGRTYPAVTSRKYYLLSKTRVPLTERVN